jgi:hypothetical protein
VNTCDNPGFNKYACFARTTKQCYWNQENGKCEDFSKADYTLNDVTCDYGVNQVVCLLIPSYPCRWDGTKGICTNITVDDSVTLASLNGFKHN